MQGVGEYLFTGEGACLALPCSNALAGEYYTDAGSPRSELVSNYDSNIMVERLSHFTHRTHHMPQNITHVGVVSAFANVTSDCATAECDTAMLTPGE